MMISERPREGGAPEALFLHQQKGRGLSRDLHQTWRNAVVSYRVSEASVVTRKNRIGRSLASKEALTIPSGAAREWKAIFE